MPSRTDVFTNECYYHVFDKTIDNRKVFDNQKVSKEFIKTFLYYRSCRAHIRYSKLKQMPKDVSTSILDEVFYPSYFLVHIVAYCLMPNHYHFLLKQQMTNGIVTFMSNSLNSFTHYYNNLNKRKGPLFLTQFKSKKITSDEQLIYVSSYIHRNPLSSGLVVSPKELCTYPYSSMKAYMGTNNERIYTQPVLLNFNEGIKSYLKYTSEVSLD